MMLTSSSSSILLPSTLLLLLLASPSYGQASVPTTISGLISQYSLTRSQILPQPSEKQSVSATAKYLKANWDLNNDKVSFIFNSKLHGKKGRLVDFSSLYHLALTVALCRSKIIGDPTFVDDPFESNSTSAVLAIDYEKASYGGGGVDGGAQFYVSTRFSLWTSKEKKWLDADLFLSPSVSTSFGFWIEHFFWSCQFHLLLFLDDVELNLISAYRCSFRTRSPSMLGLRSTREGR